MLQAYALAKYLQTLGHEVQIIDYLPNYLQGVKLFRGDPRYNQLGLGWLYVLAKMPTRLRTKWRERTFHQFFEDCLPVTQHYETFEELRNHAPKADCYIAGSDQIWNTTFRNGTDPAFYLDFGKQEVLRISYAASFATDSLVEGTEDFVKEKLANFNSISVRESSALKLLRSLGYEGVQVVDPVFLLKSEEWNEIANEDGSNEDYILVYDFMNDSSIRSIATRLAKNYTCKIFCIGPTRLSYADRNFWKEGPRSFVALVKNARCVVSNSFHGSAFALIYQKDFFVVNRKDGLNTRMRDLLTHYLIAERQISSNVNDDVLFSSIKYAAIQNIIQQDIEKSKEWLTTQLGIKQ